MDQAKQQATSHLVEVLTNNGNKNIDTLNIETDSVIQLERDTNVNSSTDLVNVNKSEELIRDIRNDLNIERKVIDETEATFKCSTCGIVFQNSDNLNRHNRLIHSSSEENQVESRSFRKDTVQIEISKTSTDEHGPTEMKGNEKDAMGSTQILHDFIYKMPSHEQHVVKGDSLSKMIPTTQTTNQSSFQFPSGCKTPIGVINDPSPQRRMTPNLIQSLSSNPYNQSMNRNMHNTSIFSQRQMERSILLQKITTFLQTIKQDIQNILENLKTENNASRIVPLQIKLKELLEKQSLFQNNYLYLIGKKPSQNLNTQQEFDQFHQNGGYQHPQQSFVPLVQHPHSQKFCPTSSQGYHGINSTFNHNGKRPYEESVDTDQGKSRKLLCASSHIFQNQQSTNFTQGITNNVMQLPFHLTSFAAEKDHLLGTMQGNDATYQVNVKEAHHDETKQFQTGLPPLPFLKPSPRLSQIPCTITRPHVHDNASYICNEKDKFVVPLLDLKKVDERILKILYEKNIDCFIPVQGNSMLGIPIMRLSMDAWRVSFSNSNGEIGGTESFTSQHSE